MSPSESAPPPTFLAHPELPPGVPAPPARRPGWRPWTAWAALIAGFAAALAGAIVVGVVGAAFGGGGFDEDPPTAVTLVATIVQDVCLVGSALLFARMSAPPLPRDFDLVPVGVRKALGWMALTFVAYFVFTGVWATLVNAESTDDEVVRDLGADESTIAMLAVALVVTVMAPIAEEVFFRGYFYGALRNWRGVWLAAIVTGVVFGGIHAGSADVAYLLPLAFLGFALCVLRERTGSLYPCIALHCVNNSLAFGVTQDWTWEILVLIAASLAVIAAVARGALALWPAVRAS